MIKEGDIIGSGSGSKFRITEFFIRAGYSDIYLGENIHDLTKVAIKIYRNDRFDDLEQAEGYWRRERAFIELQSKFGQYNLRLLDSLTDKSDPIHPRLILITNYIEAQDFNTWFEEICNDPPIEYCAYVVKFIFLPLAEYFFQCHQLGLIYRDFSSENLMIKKGESLEPIPIVIDWGAARNFDPLNLYTVPASLKDLPGGGTRIYTPSFESPEVMEGKKPIPQTDIYSFGIVMHYILTKGDYREIKLIKSDYVYEPHTVDSTIPVCLSMIVRKCTQYEPVDRFLSFIEVKTELQNVLKILSPKGVIFEETNKEKITIQKQDTLNGRILILGLQQAGKTSILTRLQNNEFNSLERPTLGVQLARIVLDTIKLQIYDVGGQKLLRYLWTTTVPYPNAIIYVVDISENEEQLIESVKEFEKIMEFFLKNRENLCVLILGNKLDLKPTYSINQLENLLQPQRFNIEYHLELCSASTNAGIRTSFKWLVFQLLKDV